MPYNFWSHLFYSSCRTYDKIKTKKISKNFADNEYDALVSAGEQISCSLLAGQLLSEGIKSRSWETLGGALLGSFGTGPQRLQKGPSESAPELDFYTFYTMSQGFYTFYTF